MEKPEILVWSESAEDLLFTAAVAEKLGFALRGPLSIEETFSRAISNSHSCVFANVSTHERLRQFKEAFAVLPSTPSSCRLDPQQVHLIGALQMDGFEEFCGSALFEHFILPGQANPELAGKHYGVTLRSLKQRDEASKDSAGEAFFEFRLLRSSDKAKALEALQSYLVEKLGLGKRVSEVMLNAVDELLMNAIFDAPKDPAGNQLLRNIRRTEDFPLSPENHVELTLRQDGEYLVFTSTDFFGSLDRDKLFKSFFRSFRERQYLLDQSVENAGLGLATTFGSGGSLVFFSQTAVKTQVSVIYRQTNSYRELLAQFRYLSVHLSGRGQERV